MQSARLMLALPEIQRCKPLRTTGFVLLLMLLMPFGPMANADTGTLRTDDFGVLEKLHEVVAADYGGEGEQAAKTAALATLEGIASSQHLSDENDPLGDSTTNLDSLMLANTTPNVPVHPLPYEILLDPSMKPDGFPETLWETLAPWGLDDYVVMTNYSTLGDADGHLAFKEASFYGELLAFPPNPFENEIDINNDGIDDIEVSLTISFFPDDAGLLDLGKGDTWDFEDEDGNSWPEDCGLLCIPTSLWLKPTISYRIKVLDERLNDPMWDILDHLEVSLMKGFTYNMEFQDGGETGESYVWVIDARFTQTPYDFELNVGLDKVVFNITGSTITAIDAITGGLLQLLNIFEGSSELSLAVLASPYSINLVNTAQTTCRVEYAPEQRELDSMEQECGLAAGLGYVHYPAGGTPNSILEMAYIDVAFHPTGDADTQCSTQPVLYCLPEEIDLIIRNDNLGEDGLDSVEFWTEKPTDVRLHYYEDRANTIEPDGNYGNISEAIAWLRRMPAESFEQDEIERIYTMLGYSNGNGLPGQMPSRLSFILGIKNFSRDDSANENDPTLPVNPHDSTAPTSLLLIASKQRIERIEYTSWFQHYGNASDHSRVHFSAEDIPEVIVLYGSFELGGEEEIDRNIANDPSLGSFSQLLDNAIISIVDVIIDIGSILNTVPEALTTTSGSQGGDINLDSLSSVRAGRYTRYIGEVVMLFGSSAHPTIPDQDHILLTRDDDLDIIDGRLGPTAPLTEVGLSLRITGLSSLHYSFDPIEDLRTISLMLTSGDPFRFGYIEHEGGSINITSVQSSLLSDRPGNLSIEQTSEYLHYSADRSIASLTYYAEAGAQRNAVRLEGLPLEFDLLIGSESGFSSEQPLGSIAVQLSNATQDNVLQGDHVYHWQDGDIGEASLSVRVSNLTKASWRSPDIPGASGDDGLARITLTRPQGTVLNAVLRDETSYANPHLGLNATIQLSPLPGHIEMDIPTEGTTASLTLPDFGEGGGIIALSQFLAGLVDFGEGMNGLIGNITRDFLGPDEEDVNASIALNLNTDEAFDILIEARKGNLVEGAPNWVHGLNARFIERTLIDVNATLLNLTSTPRDELLALLADGIIAESEREQFDALLEGKIREPEEFGLMMHDGWIDSEEHKTLDLNYLRAKGLTLHDERSYHIRVWIPQISPVVSIEYDYFLTDEVPQWSINLQMTDWQPAFSDFKLNLEGMQGLDVEFYMQGLDTTRADDVDVRLYMASDTTLVVPRISADMHFDIGTELDFARLVMLDHVQLQRIETLVLGIPSEADLSATVGDILEIDLTVPDPLGGIADHSVEALMLSMARYVDGEWWPATAFMRDLPGEVHLSTSPSTTFDITQEMTFQGASTLEYTSNGNDMDLYIFASGRAVDYRSDMLLIAEDMPSHTSIKPTDDWGMQFESFPNGIKRIYIRQSNLPAEPGVTLRSSEVIGENLRSATVHAHYIGGVFPLVTISDVTGGRVIATGELDIEIGGVTWDAKGVLIDAQITGIIPSASTFGVNGVTSDLSLLNSITGGRAQTTHIIFPEPISSGILTLLATIF